MLGPVNHRFASANAWQVLSAQAQRRIVVVLWQGAATTAGDACNRSRRVLARKRASGVAWRSRWERILRIDG